MVSCMRAYRPSVAHNTHTLVNFTTTHVCQILRSKNLESPNEWAEESTLSNQWPGNKHFAHLCVR